MQIHRFLLLACSFAQAGLAALMLTWSLPLFFNPPLLGNGVASGAYQIETLAPETAAGKRIRGAAAHYRWLFERHTEALVIVIGASVLLLTLAAITLLIAIAPKP